MKEYTQSHEWIERKDNIATVGITKQAVEEIGEIVHVELPKVGRVVDAGQEVVVLESTKAAIDIASPVSGTIIKINPAVKENVDLINKSPEQDGWLFQVSLP